MAFDFVRSWAGLSLLLFAVVGQISGAEPDVCVIRADGNDVCGTISSWTADRVVIDAGSAQNIAIDDVAELRFPKAKRRQTNSDWIVLGTGDRFPLTVQKVNDDVVTAGWPKSPRRPELSFPLENVAAIIRQMPPAATIQREWLRTIARLPAGKDSVRLVVGEDLTGEFTAWENGLVKWQGALGALQLDLQRVRWIRFDPDLTAKPARPETWWTVILVDGARFTATHCEPRPDHTVQWTLPVGGSITVPRHEIEKATRWSPRRQSLSSHEPSKVTFTPFLDGQRSLSIDQSVHASPLQLRGEEFTTGIGMQSRAEITYTLQPGDDHFTATVGVDDAAEGNGSARFAVRVDNRIAWESEELTGRSPAVRLPAIALDKAITLTLIVDFGEYGDVGDIADWCDASIWKASPRN